MNETLEHYRQQFQRHGAALPGAKLADVRRNALERFAERGFPTTRQEAWKYTDLRPLAKRRFQLAEPADAATADIEQFLIPGLDCHRIVFLDGRYQAGLSLIDDLDEGIRLAPLSQVLKENGRDLNFELGRHATDLEPLNTAFMSDGLYLRLSPGVVLEKPIHLLCLNSGKGTEEPMAHLRHLIKLGESSQATLIEHYTGISDEAPYFSTAVTEIRAGSNARFKRCRLQQESDRAYHVASLHAHQQRDSRIELHSIDLGGRLARTDTHCSLDGEGAEAHLYGVYAPTGRQHIDNQTRIDHVKSHGVSREAFRGVADGHGRGVFNGRVVVHKDAQKTDSEQSADGLLLSKKAEIDAKPELEIYADDVKCAHGNTVGQLDEDAVFYLQSRGVSEDDARSLLTYSFVDEILVKIGIEPVRRYVEQLFLQRLPGTDLLREMARQSS